MPAGELDYINDDLLTMSDSNRMNTYVIHSTEDEYSCVDSFKLYGGPSQPFEYMVIAISKKRLSTVAPKLVDDIHAGMNVITLFGFGKDGARYVVTNCKKTGSSWKITAYALAEQTRALTLSNDSYISGVNSSGFDSTNKTLLGTSAISTVNSLILNSTSALQMADNRNYKKTLFHTCIVCNSSRNLFKNPVFFKSGTSLWRVLSICAMRLNCTMWVEGDTLYLVDFSLPPSSQTYRVYDGVLGYATVFNDIGTIYLNKEGQFPYATNNVQEQILNNVIGLPSPEQEGRNFVRNKVQIMITENNDSLDHIVVDAYLNKVFSQGQIISNCYKGSSFIYENETYYHADFSESEEVSKSKETYGTIQYDLDMPELFRDDAQVIADALVEKYCDSEQPITFTMREVTVSEGLNELLVVWSPAFSSFTRADKIFDYSNDLLVSSRSNLILSITRPQKGALTGWVRNFPEHTTTYTFGEIAPTDMTQNDSIIKTALTTRGM